MGEPAVAVFDDPIEADEPLPPLPDREPRFEIDARAAEPRAARTSLNMSLFTSTPPPPPLPASQPAPPPLQEELKNDDTATESQQDEVPLFVDHVPSIRMEPVTTVQTAAPTVKEERPARNYGVWIAAGAAALVAVVVATCALVLSRNSARNALCVAPAYLTHDSDNEDDDVTDSVGVWH